ncbi:MAG: hypothetical protein JSW02_08600 [candidate division WOR-3 bacterium]|nr:MAG: hypothetical protein JSW02_08600 [candidate division WOR-3 bacterium]
MRAQDFLGELGHKMRQPLFFCAGEPSGDMYAALLAGHIRSIHPHARMFGVGGRQMQEAGITIVKPYHDMQVFGFASALVSVCASLRTYHEIVQLLKTIRPRIFIPVAYPGMNLLVCRYAKKLGAEVYYFIPPQIWAWGMFRKHFLRAWVDTVISILPFEHRLYSRLGVNTVLIQNPLERTLRAYRRTNRKPCIGFMPGSRVRDARRQLPMMSRVAARVLGSRPDMRCVFIIPEKNGSLHRAVRETTDMLNRQVEEERTAIETEDRYAVMKNCDLLIVSSGTASLEAFLMHVPQIFVHKPSFIDHYFLKPFLRIKEFNLVNLLHEEGKVPACVHRDSDVLVQFIQQNLHRYFD